MIESISGKLIEKREQSLIINLNGIHYEVIVSASVLSRIENTKDSDGNVNLIIYHYLQIGPSSAVPILIGFINKIEKDFFSQFIKVSGIGPKAAVKAINKPISDITRAIDIGDVNFLKTLPGIGMQKAKEIVAKLQGKIGKYGLIKDHTEQVNIVDESKDWKNEALEILLQLQYKKSEAQEMIDKALERNKNVRSSEELLNEIYKQRINK